MVAITVTENAYDIDANAISTVPDADDNALDTPRTGTALNTREETVWAALAASPGTSVAVIAGAAGISRVTVGKILNQFEAEGRVSRVPGGHDGRGRTPDLWYPADGTTVSGGDTPEEAPDSPGSDDSADPDVPAVSDVDDEGSADEEATDAAVPAINGQLAQADPEGAAPADVAGDTPTRTAAARMTPRTRPLTRPLRCPTRTTRPTRTRTFRPTIPRRRPRLKTLPGHGRGRPCWSWPT